ncbi:hypothetical protein [Azospirillum cavernae]|uniref:hypothetical protein n=1 Tax=Azospirillum cavernae TaxID=2320860 RepID=UPI0018F3B027|nr:hypothetical protein [Azospirillum cavernae]
MDDTPESGPAIHRLLQSGPDGAVAFSPIARNSVRVFSFGIVPNGDCGFLTSNVCCCVQNIRPFGAGGTDAVGVRRVGC